MTSDRLRDRIRAINERFDGVPADRVPADQLARFCAGTSLIALMDVTELVDDGRAGDWVNTRLDTARAWADLARAYTDIARNDR